MNKQPVIIKVDPKDSPILKYAKRLKRKPIWTNDELVPFTKEEDAFLLLLKQAMKENNNQEISHLLNNDMGRKLSGR